MPSRTVLGLDPGIGTTGYGVVRDEDGRLEHVAHGTLTTPARTPDPDRLVTLKQEIDGLIAEHRPARIGIEKLVFGRNVTTAMSVGQARGVLVLACRQAEVPVVEVSPSQVKQAATGHGAAPKGQVQQMVRTILGLDKNPSPDDAADALAVAICASSARA